MTRTFHNPRVVLVMLAILVVGLMAAFGTAQPADATDDGNDGKVCRSLDSGKIDLSGGKSITVTAPEGQLIDAYCVKAGSAKQGNGPVYVSVDPPAKTVTITHPSGKGLSHYSLSYVSSDVCPDMPGEQPPGSDCDEDEDDACPDMPGHQPPGTDCDEDEDACPDMDGWQPPGTDCDTEECPGGDMNGDEPGCGVECPDGDYNGDEPGCGTCPPKDECPPPIQPGDADDLRCVGKVYGGLYEDVVVPRGESCNLIRAYVNGSVTAKGARTVRVLDSTVVGGIYLDRIKRNVKIGNEDGCKYDPLVGKSITVTNSHNVLLCEMKVCDRIVVSGNDGRITLRHNRAPRIKVIDNRRYDRKAGEPVNHGNPGAIRILRNKMNTLVTTGNHPSRDIIKRRNSYDYKG